jgi:hypothetical protein
MKASFYRPTWTTSAEVKAIAAIHAHLAAACRMSVRVPAFRCAMICWSNRCVSAWFRLVEKQPFDVGRERRYDQIAADRAPPDRRRRGCRATERE